MPPKKLPLDAQRMESASELWQT